jgi:hypothetical protein
MVISKPLRSPYGGCASVIRNNVECPSFVTVDDVQRLATPFPCQLRSIKTMRLGKITHELDGASCGLATLERHTRQ